MENNKVSYLTPGTKDIARWVTDLHVKAKTINLPDENTGEYLQNETVSKDFLARMQKAITMKG